MTDPNYYSPLARTHRTIFFYILLLVFIIIVPLLGFYANGYRYNPWAEDPSVTITGGLYIATQVDESDIYVNEKLADNSRFFQRATFVQNLLPGTHNIHVQGAGLQTWTKQLPVYQQIVTEVAAFTIPERPQVRPITPYQTADGEPVFIDTQATATVPFAFASSTVSAVISSSTATTTWERNPEYTFLETRFAALNRPVYEQSETPQFRFATSTPTDRATTTATSTRQQNNLRLERRADEVYARYVGTLRNIPYYFCIPTQSATSTTNLYGQHVSDAIYAQVGSAATTTIHERGTWLGQVCRTEIRIDRKNQPITWFDFVPGNSNLVLLHLADGVYVTEIDDRGWQNHQLLYPGTGLTVLVDGGQVFIRDGGYFVESFLTLPD